MAEHGPRDYPNGHVCDGVPGCHCARHLPSQEPMKDKRVGPARDKMVKPTTRAPR